MTTHKNIKQINMSYNYEAFGFAQFNRTLVKDTIVKLICEYEKEDNFMYFPIIVDQNMVIIDGQHRFSACKDLGLPIYFIVKNTNCSPMDVRSVNKAGRKHNVRDIFEMELKLGNPEVLKVQALINHFRGKVDLSSAVSVCAGTGASTGHHKSTLENGSFKACNMISAYNIFDGLIELLSGGRISVTITSIISSVAKEAKISKEELIDDLLKKGLRLECSMTKTNITNRIIETYNYRRKLNRVQ